MHYIHAFALKMPPVGQWGGERVEPAALTSARTWVGEGKGKGKVRHIAITNTRCVVINVEIKSGCLIIKDLIWVRVLDVTTVVGIREISINLSGVVELKVDHIKVVLKSSHVRRATTSPK